MTNCNLRDTINMALPIRYAVSRYPPRVRKEVRPFVGVRGYNFDDRICDVDDKADRVHRQRKIAALPTKRAAISFSHKLLVG